MIQKQNKTICIYGSHDLDYPRNNCIQDLILLSGYKIILCHSKIAFPFRHFHLPFLLLKNIRKVKLVFVTEGGNRLIIPLKIICFFFNKKIIFDPFISRYNTRIEDRKLYPKIGLQALICKWQDWSACFFSNYLIFDTLEHQKYFYTRYHLRKPYSIIPVSIDEKKFIATKKTNKSLIPLKIIFYGTYIPLHGIQYILEAISKLKTESAMEFTLIGSGQTFKEMKLLAKKYSISPKILKKNMDLDSLIENIKQSDICLGIFDGGTKASQVVPNKVVQCAALGKCIITRESVSVKRYFTHNQNIILVPPANFNAIASALLELEKNISKINDIGKKAHQVFQDNFSKKHLLNTMDKALTYFDLK